MNRDSNYGTLTALVLAAGLSRRFGQPKQLLPYRGTTLLGWVVAQVESCPAVDDVILTLGQASDEILASLTLHCARPVVAQDYHEGCAASYRTGLAAADPQTRGLMIIPGDQPGIDAAIIGRMADAWRATLGADARGDASDDTSDARHANHAAILVASYHGVDGHPLIFDRCLFAELADLHGDKAAWKLLDRHPDSVRRVEMGRAAPSNINTPEDYARLIDTSHSS